MNEKEIYFQIKCGDDGIYIYKIHDIDAYLKEICENEMNGEKHVFLSDFPEDRYREKTDVIDQDTFPDYHETILIKGKIVCPTPRKVALQYEIE